MHHLGGRGTGGWGKAQRWQSGYFLCTRAPNTRISRQQRSFCCRGRWNYVSGTSSPVWWHDCLCLGTMSCVCARARVLTRCSGSLSVAKVVCMYLLFRNAMEHPSRLTSASLLTSYICTRLIFPPDTGKRRRGSNQVHPPISIPLSPFVISRSHLFAYVASLSSVLLSAPAVIGSGEMRSFHGDNTQLLRQYRSCPRSDLPTTELQPVVWWTPDTPLGSRPATLHVAPPGKCAFCVGQYAARSLKTPGGPARTFAFYIRSTCSRHGCPLVKDDNHFCRK